MSEDLKLFIYTLAGLTIVALGVFLVNW